MKHNTSDNDLSITALLNKIKDEVNMSGENNTSVGLTPELSDNKDTAPAQGRYHFRITKKKRQAKHIRQDAEQETKENVPVITVSRGTPAISEEKNRPFVFSQAERMSVTSIFDALATGESEIAGESTENEASDPDASVSSPVMDETQNTAPTTEAPGQTEGESAADSALTDADVSDFSEDELDAMLKRFLPDEEYTAYEQDCDLSRTSENLAAVQLEDPAAHDDEPIAEPAGEKAEDDKADTREFDTPNAGTDSVLIPPDIDETDMNLMIAFGLEDELKQKIGKEKADELNKKINDSAQQYEEMPEKKKPVFAEPEAEYTSPAQNKEIFDRYKKKYSLSLIRLGISAVLLLISFIFENIGVFGGKLADAFDSKIYPIVFVMTDLQLLLFGCVLIWRQLKDGTIALFHMKPKPESITAVLAAGGIVFNILMCFRTYGVEIRLYNFPLLMLMFISLIAEFMDLRREIFSFHIVASKRMKYTIGQLSPDAATLETEAFEEYLPDAPSIFKLSKAGFVDNFYRRMHGQAESKRYLKLMIPLSVVFGVLFFVLSTVMKNNAATSMVVAYIAMMMTMPFAALMFCCLPMYFASERAYESDSAIIGEGSVDEYSNASSVSFDDKDVFPSKNVKVTSVMVFGNNRIDEVIRNVTGVFHVAGGPLRDVLENITSDFECPSDVRLISVAADGIEAVVSGSHMYLGKAEYLRRNHYIPVTSDDDAEIERAGQQSLMFVVCDDEVVAKMYISYKIDAEFENTLKQLYKSDICVGIKTFDPNIDDDMLSHRIKLDKYPVRVLKCREIEENTQVMSKTDSGIVSKRSAKAALRTFTMCGRIVRIERIGLVLSFIAMFAGAVVVGVSLMFGGAAKIASLYVALYQLFWLLPLYLFAKAYIK